MSIPVNRDQAMETFESFFEYVDDYFIRMLDDLSNIYSATKNIPTKSHMKLRSWPKHEGADFEDVITGYMDGWTVS
jgi:hypothetical protein